MKQIDLTQEELASLCMALAHLIHAGIGTGDAIALLKEDEEDPDRRAILTEMANSADEGLPLAELFRRAACFPAYVCNLLEVGEQAGKTEETLTALARYYEGRVRMVQRLRAALLYPVVLLVVLLAVAVCLLVWVLPVFNEVYAQLGSSLTGVAGGLLAAGQILGRALPGLLAVLCLLAAAAAVAAHSPKLRRRLRTEGEKRWGDRGVLGRINTARFTQALSLALSSGMDANQAVTMAASLVSEVPGLQRRCNDCLDCLDRGESLARSLRTSGLLSGADCRLLEAGERSGQSETVAADIAQRQLEDSENGLEQAVGRLEPTLVVLACLLVGAILLSVMLPLSRIMTAIG